MASGTVDKAEAKILGRALQVLRSRAGLSQERAGATIGLSGEGWRKYELGSPGLFRPDMQERLSGALGFTRVDLLEERSRVAGDPAPPVRSPMPRVDLAPTGDHAPLTIRDRVQAGAWLAADDFDQSTPRITNTLPDPRFPRAEQWLSEVAGDSVNALGIVDGDTVHCVAYWNARSQPRTGDIVEVERTRFGGSMRELTIKQVEVTESQILLWPRSTNPRWREPIALDDGIGSGEQFEVTIRGLVLAAIRHF